MEIAGTGPHHEPEDDVRTAYVSPHLTWRELACKDGTPYPPQWQERGLLLATVFEAIRAIWNRPIVVGSAYRSPVHNRRVGGSPTSQHLYGLAMDLYPPANVTATDMHAAVRTYAVSNAGVFHRIGALGLYPWGIHVDLRERVRGNLVEWEIDR